MKLHSHIAVTFACLLVSTAAAYSIPPDVQRCLNEHRELKLDTSQKPSILAVHFRGTLPEYVIAVHESSGRGRALAMVCGKAGSVVLGGSPGNPFSDMPDDAYMSTRWRVCREPQIAELRKYYSNVPDVKLEGVCLTWEDGEALIYWDGTAFRFKSFNP